MSQDPRKLRKLLEILTKFGVTSYETEGIKIEVANPSVSEHKTFNGKVPVANSEFSMDNYAKGPIDVSEENENVHPSKEDEVSFDEEMLYWSASS